MHRRHGTSAGVVVTPLLNAPTWRVMIKPYCETSDLSFDELGHVHTRHTILEVKGDWQRLSQHHHHA